MSTSISSSGISFSDGTKQASSPAPFYRNKIRNGAMMIDQRLTATTAITPANSTDTYTLDGWVARLTTGGAYSVAQQSATIPGNPNLVNCLTMTVTSANTAMASNAEYSLKQKIEAPMLYDLAFGTPSAKTLTLSFWVKSSVVGTYTGFLSNNANIIKTYAFPYVINVADTWQQVVVTIPGETQGRNLWNASTIGMILGFSLGMGSGFATSTTGSWFTNSNTTATLTTQVPWIATAGATFSITGVQLEVGSTNTAFELQWYSAELLRNQRYFIKYFSGGTSDMGAAYGGFNAATVAYATFPLPTHMRVSPTLALSGTVNAVSGATNFAVSSPASNATSTIAPTWSFTVSGATTNAPLILTAGASGSITLSAEL